MGVPSLRWLLVAAPLSWVLFLGLIVIPLIGNAAEHATAVVVARRGQTDLALHIALGSSTQVALFVAPLVVAAGALLGQPMNHDSRSSLWGSRRSS
ncbi:MAG: hypothetical protein DMD33_06295 [Gemmatimonadetes bacterium]|nr:MAG: hypothetical protein DMD33_06295 [Gemmatimonadota bacterium]PYO72361.1 MAG: hypothetical protein DMD67_17185 [Gemmatimonadota bacterium]TLY46881.1 MAG: hypothetical protein E6K55_15190 [Gemmatimonadota bacterium]